MCPGETLFNHPRCQGRNLAGGFGEGNKFVGKNKTERGVKPSNECFKTADPVCLQVNLWLEVNRQFILLESRSELLKQSIPYVVRWCDAGFMRFDLTLTQR